MKRIGLAAAGLLAGFVLTAVLSTIATALLRKLWPALGRVGQGYALETLDFAYALLCIGVGGVHLEADGRRRRRRGSRRRRRGSERCDGGARLGQRSFCAVPMAARAWRGRSCVGGESDRRRWARRSRRLMLTLSA